MNIEQKLTQEEIQRRAGENSDIYFACGEPCPIEELEESYWW